MMFVEFPAICYNFHVFRNLGFFSGFKGFTWEAWTRPASASSSRAISWRQECADYCQICQMQEYLGRNISQNYILDRFSYVFDLFPMIFILPTTKTFSPILLWYFTLKNYFVKLETVLSEICEVKEEANCRESPKFIDFSKNALLALLKVSISFRVFWDWTSTMFSAFWFSDWWWSLLKWWSWSWGKFLFTSFIVV